MTVIGFKLGIPELFVLTIGLALVALVMFAWAKIFSKAGYSPALCILMLIPLVSLIAFFWFAFSAWPLQRLGTAGTPSPRV
jgi:ATP/ADP translocase